MEARHNEYFEGILQVRNPNEEVLDFIAKEVEKKGNVFVAKAKKTRNPLELSVLLLCRIFHELKKALFTKS